MFRLLSNKKIIEHVRVFTPLFFIVREAEYGPNENKQAQYGNITRGSLTVVNEKNTLIM